MSTMPRAATQVRLKIRAAAFAAAMSVSLLSAVSTEGAGRRARLSDDLAQKLAGGDLSSSRVILTGTQERVVAVAARHGLRIRKRLATGAVLEVPAGRLDALAADADVDQLSSDHPVRANMAVTNVTIGADQVWAGVGGRPGTTGVGVGVAVIDSGIADHPALRGRVVARVDFTNPRGAGDDEYGHGTHVAGIIAAGRRDEADLSGGVAPGAHLINLKVLGADGSGSTSDVIAAIDWAIANRRTYKIRILNLSLGHPVLESWRDDPLCQAVERAYRAGLLVVASAGNYGKTADGRLVLGG